MGAAAFLMAEFLQVTYADVVIAAVVPAILFVFAVLIQADIEAARQDLPAVPEDKIRPLGEVMRAGWYFPVPFAVLVFALFPWNLPRPRRRFRRPARCSCAYAVRLSRPPRSPARLLGALTKTGRASVDIVLVGAAAGIVIAILDSTGLGFGLTFLLVELGDGLLFLVLVLTAVICVILGMGMPTTGIYLLVATLSAPPLIKLGMDPIAAHLFILYFGLMSMISPPVAIAAFTAASIAKTSPMQTAFTSVRLGWPAFIIPFLFVDSPSLLLRAGWPADLLAVGTTAAGMWLFCIALAGFFRQRLRLPARLATFALAAVLLFPAQALLHL